MAKAPLRSIATLLLGIAVVCAPARLIASEFRILLNKVSVSAPERKITIRLPKSLHDSLRIESEALKLSINKLCISKLLQRIESRFVPVQQGRRRGRRPGPQGPRKKTDGQPLAAEPGSPPQATESQPGTPPSSGRF